MKKYIQSRPRTHTDGPALCISREQKFVNDIVRKIFPIDDHDNSMTEIDSGDRQVIESGTSFDLISRK